MGIEKGEEKKLLYSTSYGAFNSGKERVNCWFPGVGGEGSEPPDQQADEEDPPDRQVPPTAPGHMTQGQHNSQEPPQQK
jgi:hypothetical protein